MKKKLASLASLASAAAMMSSPLEKDRRKGASLLGGAKTAKKAAAARINGTRPKRKKAVEYFETDPRWKMKAIPPK